VVGVRSRLTGALRHAPPAFVAVAYSALAFADGGYSQELISGATIGIWLVVAIGVATRAWPRAPLPTPAVVSGCCLAGLGALSALSMLWADDAGRAFFSVVRVGGYLGLLALVVAASPRGGARDWLGGLAAGLTIVCVASLATRFDPSLFGDGDRTLSQALPYSVGRLRYPIGYWNGLAACLAIDLVLLLWWGMHARARLGRALAVGLAPLPLLAIYLTSSRGGLAAALAGLVVLLALARARATMLGGTLLAAAGGTLLVLVARTQGDFLDGLATSTAYTQGLEMFLVTIACVLAVGLARYRLDDALARLRMPAVRWRIVVPVLVVAAAIILVAVDVPGRVNEFTSVYGRDGAGVRHGHLTSASGSGRYQFWQAALDAFGTSPVKGIGAGNYELWWNAHPEAPLWIVNAHSLYLETLAELGIGGLALVLGFLGAAAVSGVRRAKGPLRPEVAAALAVLAAGTLSAGLDWTWQLTAAFAPVVIAVGLLTGPATAASAAGGEPTTSMTPGRLALVAAAVAIGWACVWAAGIALATDLKLDASRAAAARGDLASAADDASDAAGIQPWSPEPRLQLALVEELAGNLRSARSAVGEAIHRAPHDWRPWAVAARIDARLHERRASKESAAFASALSPAPLPARALRPLGR
jgi:hypothetical protein